MTKTLLLVFFVVFCFLTGCGKKATPTVVASPTPAATIDAQQGFNSPEGLTKFLEQRWPLAGIQTFCIPERRHNQAFPNLAEGVDSTVVWRGTLFSNQQTGFDKISWYANTKNNRVTEYSLGVTKGPDFWLLEIADEEDVRQPPDFAPDPKLDEFVGHK
jgi:hypothetical protein